jgi:phosphoserine phosphatase
MMGYDREQTVAVGDSLEDLDVARVVGRFFMVANGPERDPGIREALPRFDNVTVTEGQAGEGFFQAVVESLVTDGA